MQRVPHQASCNLQNSAEFLLAERGSDFSSQDHYDTGKAVKKQLDPQEYTNLEGEPF